LESFDPIVMGSGPAGEKGAAQAAYFGKRVALLERRAELGGAGFNMGAVPSKALRASALYLSGPRERGPYGIDYSLREALTVAGIDILPRMNAGDSLLRLSTWCCLFDGFLLRCGVP
jgi:pyruvate/2-oxoglutarate dehydrogenase complex dihydrolipoamide dehydrogenase (E3) component